MLLRSVDSALMAAAGDAQSAFCSLSLYFVVSRLAAGVAAKLEEVGEAEEFQPLPLGPIRLQ